MEFNLLFKYLNDKKICDLILEDFIEFFNSKSQTFQILAYFKTVNEGSTEDLVEIERFKEFQLSTLIKRLADTNKLKAIDKEGKFKIYTLNELGEIEVDNSISNFLNKNWNYREWITQKRKDKLELTTNNVKIKTIHSALIDANIKPNVEDKIIINMKELAEINYEATDLIYSDFKESMYIIRECFKNDVENITVNDIIVKNIQESEFKPIHTYNRDTKSLIYTKGLVTSKKEEITSKTTKYVYSCDNESCSYNQNKLNAYKKLSACPKCKSKLNLIEEDRINLLASKITDVETGISFKIHIYGERTKEYALVGLGDEIEVIGYLEDHIEDEKGNGIEKVLILNSFWNSDYTKELTKEEITEVERVLSKYENPKDYLIKAFDEYIEQEWVKELFILQQLTRFNPETKETCINIAVMGEPGVGKNELIKIAETYFPNCDAIVGADITDAGFKGTVNRDTGIKEIGLAKKCQGGTLFFNEFDKFVKTNSNGKKAGSQLLNASITEQEIRLNKAGIKIRMRHLDLRHNLIFNPFEESKTDDKIKYDAMSLVIEKSLLSRMLPIYIGKDEIRSKKVFELMLKPKSKANNIEIDKYKLLIRHLRAKKITFSKKAQDTLRDIYNSLLEKTRDNTVSVERVGQMLIQLCYAVCRLHNKDVCEKEHVKYVYDLYLASLKSVGITLENLERLFMDKTLQELETKKEIWLHIENELTLNNNLHLDSLKDLNQELLKEVIADKKRDGELFEPRKGLIKRLE